MTRRTINWKVLVISAVVALVLLVGLKLLHGWQLGRLASGLLDIAEAREQEEKWQEAAMYCERYLRIHPNDVVVRVRLASDYAQGALTPAEKTRAVDLHYRALAADPGKEEAIALRSALAGLLVETGRFGEAEREARQVCELATDHPSARRALALALLAQWENGSLSTAKPEELQLLANAEKARGLNPTDVVLAEITAQFLRNHASIVVAELPQLSTVDRNLRADACLDDLVARAGTNANAYLARFRYRKRYQLPGADDDIAKAMEIAPEDPEVLLTAAKAAHQQAALAKAAGAADVAVAAQFQRARDLYQKQVTEKESAPYPDCYLGLGDVTLALGDLENAVSTWRMGLKRYKLPTIQIAFLSRIADGLLNAERSSDASDSLDAIDSLVSTIGSSVPRDERLAIMQSQSLRRAAWYMQRNQTALAVPLLQEAVARQGSGSSGNGAALAAWSSLARAHAQMGEWHEAASAFDQAAPLDPQSSSIRLWAGLAWLQVGRADLAVERIEQSLAIRSSAEALMQLATAENERQRALPAAQRSWDRLERTLNALERDEKAVQQLSSPWQLEFLRADLAMSKNRDGDDELRGRTESVAWIKKAEAKHGNAAGFWSLAATSYQRLGDKDSSDRALGRYEALVTSDADRAILRSRLASMRGDLQGAQRTLEDAASRATTADQQRLRQQLLEVAFARSDVALAERLLAAEAQQQPGNVNVLRRCCELALQRGDREAVQRWQRELAKAGEIGSWWARYFRTAQQTAESTEPDDSQLSVALEKLSGVLEEIDKLIVIRPHWPMPYALRGMVEVRRGNLEERRGNLEERRGNLKEAASALKRAASALERGASALEQAVQLGERRLATFEQLVALLDRLNRTADAERYLSRLEAYMPFSQRLTEIASEYQIRGDHPQQAVAIARAAVAKRDNDPQAHLWLARLLLLNNEFEPAEREFKKALELSPEDARAWNGLFTYYLRLKKPELARQTLEELGKKAKLAPLERSFVLGQGYELLGDLKSAEAHYEEATKVANPRIDVLVRLAAVYLRVSPDKAEHTLRQAVQLDPASAPARRMLASLLATQGDAAKLQEAESLLKSVDPSTSIVPIEDRRLNALLLAQYGDARQVSRAVELLEDVVKKSEGGVPGDELILAQLYEAQARTSPDPAIATAKRDAARERLLSVVGRVDPQPGHFAAVIEFFLRNKQSEEAGKWLDKFEISLQSGTKVEPATIGQFVELRLRHGSGDKAEKWLRQLVEADKDPLRPVAMQAAWLNTQGRAAEIEPLVEPMAVKTIADATDDRERGRRARLIGDLYAKMGQVAAAQRWYGKAVGYDAAQFPAQVRALAQAGELVEAVRICRERAGGESSSQPAVVLASVLAEVNTQADLGPEIDAFFVSQLEQHPQDARLLYAIATLRAVQGRYEDSVRYYRALIKFDSKNIAALNNLAMVLAETPDGRVESLKLINQAIEIAGQQPGLLDTKGAILVYQGEAKQALFILEAAAREAGNDARHRFHLAAAYHGVGDSEKARQQLASAINMDLEKQVLTPMDRRILSDLKSALIQ